MFIRVWGVWVGGLVLGGWVPKNPKTPQPLINEAWCGLRLVNPCPKNKNWPQTKNRPKNKNRLGLSTERVKNKNHLGHKQDKSGEH